MTARGRVRGHRMAVRVVTDLPGKPVPCPRPRVGKHGAYFSDGYKAWRETAQVLLRDACVKQNGGRLIEGPVKVVVAFYGAHKSADLDNLIKSVLDASQGTIFVNDRQVVELRAAKHDGDKPHTAIEIVEQH